MASEAKSFTNANMLTLSPELLALVRDASQKAVSDVFFVNVSPVVGPVTWDELSVVAKALGHKRVPFSKLKALGAVAGSWAQTAAIDVRKTSPVAFDGKTGKAASPDKSFTEAFFCLSRKGFERELAALGLFSQATLSIIPSSQPAPTKEAISSATEQLEESWKEKKKEKAQRAEKTPAQLLEEKVRLRYSRNRGEAFAKGQSAKADLVTSTLLEICSLSLRRLEDGKLRWKPTKSLGYQLRKAGFVTTTKGCPAVVAGDALKSLAGIPLISFSVRDVFPEPFLAPQHSFELSDWAIRAAELELEKNNEKHLCPVRHAASTKMFTKDEVKGFLSGNLIWRGPFWFMATFGEDASRVHASVKSLLAQAAYRTQDRDVRSFVVNLSSSESMKRFVEKMELKGESVLADGQTFESFVANFGFDARESGEIDGISICGRKALVSALTERFQFRALSVMAQREIESIVLNDSVFQEKLKEVSCPAQYNTLIKACWAACQKGNFPLVRETGIGHPKPRFLKGVMRLETTLADDVIFFDVNALKGREKDGVKQFVKEHDCYVTDEMIVGLMQDYGDGSTSTGWQFMLYANPKLPSSWPVENRRGKWAFSLAQGRFRDHVTNMIEEFSKGELSEDSMEALSTVLSTDSNSRKTRLFRSLWNHASVRYEFFNLIQNYTRRNAYGFVTEGMSNFGLIAPKKDYVLDMNDLPSFEDSTCLSLDSGQIDDDGQPVYVKTRVYEGILSDPDFWSKTDKDHVWSITFEHPVSDRRVIAIVKLSRPSVFGKELPKGLYFHSSIAKVVLTGDTDGDMAGFFPLALNLSKDQDGQWSLDSEDKEDFEILWSMSVNPTAHLWNEPITNVEDYIEGAGSVKALPLFWAAESNSVLSMKMVGSAALLQGAIIRLHDAYLLGQVTSADRYQKWIFETFFPALRMEIAALMELGINVMKKDISIVMPEAIGRVFGRLGSGRGATVMAQVFNKDPKKGEGEGVRDDWSTRVSQHVFKNFLESLLEKDETRIAKSDLIMNGQELLMAESAAGKKSTSRLCDMAKLDDHEFRIGEKSLQDFGVLQASGLQDGIALSMEKHRRNVLRSIQPALENLTQQRDLSVANRIVSDRSWQCLVPTSCTLPVGAERLERIFDLWTKKQRNDFLLGRSFRADAVLGDMEASGSWKGISAGLKSLGSTSKIALAGGTTLSRLAYSLVLGWATTPGTDVGKFDWLRKLMPKKIIALFHDYHLVIAAWTKKKLRAGRSDEALTKDLKLKAEALGQMLSSAKGEKTLLGVLLSEFGNSSCEEWIECLLDVNFVWKDGKYGPYQTLARYKSSEQSVASELIGAVASTFRADDKPSKSAVIQAISLRKAFGSTRDAEARKVALKELEEETLESLTDGQRVGLWRAGHSPELRSVKFGPFLSDAPWETGFSKNIRDSYLSRLGCDAIEAKGLDFSAKLARTFTASEGEFVVQEKPNFYWFEDEEPEEREVLVAKGEEWIREVNDELITDSIVFLFRLDELDSPCGAMVQNHALARIACGFDQIIVDSPREIIGALHSERTQDAYAYLSEHGLNPRRYSADMVCRSETTKDIETLIEEEIALALVDARPELDTYEQEGEAEAKAAYYDSFASELHSAEFDDFDEDSQTSGVDSSEVYAEHVDEEAPVVRKVKKKGVKKTKKIEQEDDLFADLASVLSDED